MRAWTFLLAFLLSTTNIGCALRWVRHPAAEAKFTKATVVPLRLFSGEILVQASIGGQEGWFFVDTGAPISAISPALAKKIAKKKVSSIQVSGATEGEISSRLLRFDGLVLGGVTFDKVLAVELNLSAIEEVMGIEISGILGLSLFAELLLTIDYPGSQLIFEEGSLPAANQQDILTYTLQEGHLAVPVKFGSKTLSVVLDTGSNSFLDFPESQEATLRFQAEPVVSGIARGATGTASQRSARLDGDLLLGRYVISAPIISMFKTEEISVGGPFLKSFALSIDQKQGLLRLTRSETTSITCPPVKTLGAGLAKRDGAWRVTSLLPASAASGFMVGDVILSANQQPTRDMNYFDWEQLINTHERLQLVLQRGQETIERSAPVITLVP
jgi:predicted aspartyl protease